jgi:mRNA interferase MazF
MAALRGNDVILCQITSRAVTDSYAVPLSDADFIKGGLRQTSNVRPNRLFTAGSSIILYRAGALTAEKMRGVTETLVAILEA